VRYSKFAGSVSQYDIKAVAVEWFPRESADMQKRWIHSAFRLPRGQVRRCPARTPGAWNSRPLCHSVNSPTVPLFAVSTEGSAPIMSPYLPPLISAGYDDRRNSAPDMSSARVRAKWWFWRGRQVVRQKQFESALSYFQHSLILLPESAHALCYVGYCLGALSRYEEALIFHDRALQLKPDYGSAHAQLGRMLMYLKRPQDAVESLTRAFRIQPNLGEHVPYLSALAKCLGDLGRIEDALSAYREAATRDAKDVEMQAGIGWALWKSGNCKDAEGPLRNAIKLDPNYADSYDILGTVLRDLGRDEESIAVWQRLIELTPESADAHASLGWALGGVGRYCEAILAPAESIGSGSDLSRRLLNRLVSLSPEGVSRSDGSGRESALAGTRCGCLLRARGVTWRTGRP
jgi:tetratricopeptide (TPR) repeat protein